MAGHSDTLITQFLQEFDQTSPVDCKKSKEDYYEQEFQESYTIGNERRGSALVICMTQDRPGWIHDARIIRDVLPALNIIAGKDHFVFNPTYKKIKEKLYEFAERPDNDAIDCSFIIFMGHGCQVGSDTCMVLKREDNQREESFIALFEESSLIFTRRKSRLKNKPKSFIIQTCRGNRSDSPRVQPLSYGEEDCVNLRDPEPVHSFRHYFIFNATQPGCLAPRNEQTGSTFIKNFVTKLWEHSHNSDIEAVFKKTLRETYLKITEPCPQKSESADYKLNLFPGIDKSIVERIANSASPPTMQTTPGPAMVTNEEDDVSDGQFHKCIKIQVSENQEMLRQFLSENKDSLSEELSEEADGNVDVKEVRDGCILLDILIHGIRTVKRLQYLSDKNILVRILKEYVMQRTKDTENGDCSSYLTTARILTQDEKLRRDTKNLIEEIDEWAKERETCIKRVQSISTQAETMRKTSGVLQNSLLGVGAVACGLVLFALGPAGIMLGVVGTVVAGGVAITIANYILTSLREEKTNKILEKDTKRTTELSSILDNLYQHVRKQETTHDSLGSQIKGLDSARASDYEDLILHIRCAFEKMKEEMKENMDKSMEEEVNTSPIVTNLGFKPVKARGGYNYGASGALYKCASSEPDDTNEEKITETKLNEHLTTLKEEMRRVRTLADHVNICEYLPLRAPLK